MNNNHTFKQERTSATSSNNRVPLDEAQLLADEAKYCSHGDTVHYVNPLKFLRIVRAAIFLMTRISHI